MNIKMKGGTVTSIPIKDIQKLTFHNITAADEVKFQSVIKTFALFQNYPNPFNPTTTIKYQINRKGLTKVMIFDLNGRLIKTLENTFKSEGVHSVVWDGRTDNGKLVASGVYFCQVAFENSVLVNKMLLLK